MAHFLSDERLTWEVGHLASDAKWPTFVGGHGSDSEAGGFRVRVVFRWRAVVTVRTNAVVKM